MSETPRASMGPHNQPSKSPIRSEIGENIDGFAARIETLLKTQEGTIEAEHNSVKFQVKPGMNQAEVVAAFKRESAKPRLRKTSSGLEIFSPEIGENSAEFLRVHLERALRENRNIAFEIQGISFEVYPQERKVLFGLVDYHRLKKSPITLEDVLAYLEASSRLHRRY